MIYDKEKLQNLIERLETIKEYDYITYPDEDQEKVKQILNTIDEQIILWETMQDSNFSY